MGRNSYRVMIVAGEASGDLHAAKLVDALRATAPEVPFEFFGAAGEKMREAGVEAVVEADRMSIVGLIEIGTALPMFLRAFRQLKEAARARRPDVVILVDFPDFNLKLARSLHKQGFKIVYYISPQLWAWRRYRTRTIRRYVDLLISILPFEKEWYAARGITHVEYVGSPLAREVHPQSSKEEFCLRHLLDSNRPIVALLPGSRDKEILRILPVLLETAAQMWKTDPSIQFVIAAGSEKNFGDVKDAVAKFFPGDAGSPLIVRDETFDALNAADAASVASGTATLEAGIIGTPMAIVYKTSQLNYKLLRPLIDVEHFGLINLIAGERVASEFIQDEFTAAILAKEIERLLQPDVNAAVREKLRQAVEKLGHGGASKRAAEIIRNLLEPL